MLAGGLGVRCWAAGAVWVLGLGVMSCLLFGGNPPRHHRRGRRSAVPPPFFAITDPTVAPRVSVCPASQAVRHGHGARPADTGRVGEHPSQDFWHAARHTPRGALLSGAGGARRAAGRGDATARGGGGSGRRGGLVAREKARGRNGGEEGGGAGSRRRRRRAPCAEPARAATQGAIARAAGVSRGRWGAPAHVW